MIIIVRKKLTAKTREDSIDQLPIFINRDALFIKIYICYDYKSTNYGKKSMVLPAYSLIQQKCMFKRPENIFKNPPYSRILLIFEMNSRPGSRCYRSKHQPFSMGSLFLVVLVGIMPNTYNQTG